MPDIWELPGNPNPTIAANARGRRAGARRPAQISVSGVAGRHPVPMESELALLFDAFS